LGHPDSCQKIGCSGVQTVNGENVSADPGVLKLDEATLHTQQEHVSRFDALFAHFYPELFGLLYRVLGDRMETEDTLQETFLKLTDEAALQVRPDDEVGTWLRRVGLNLAFNRLRSARRSQARLERVGRLERSGDVSGEMDVSSPSNVIVRREEREAVRRALAEVPERQRECLLLRHSGYSYAEIASTLGIAVGSVGVLLARAEHAFRTQYRRQNANP
jgi:RNA polymerase sigma factor (sigma-70 family)